MQYPIQQIKQTILRHIQQQFKDADSPKEIPLEIPREGFGDFALPCFSFAAILKKKPAQIAQEFAENLHPIPHISSIESAAGYINFFIDQKYLTTQTLDLIFSKKDTYGHLQPKKEKIIIEHTSANPNGPLHVGRARNPIIGDTLVRIFKAAGYPVESQFYLDDMGKQVAILTWGVDHLNTNDIPPAVMDKPDHKQVGFYQQANKLMQENQSVNTEIETLIGKAEKGDKKTLQQIHQAYQPVLDGINQSLHKLNITLDSYIPESQFVKDKSVETIITNLKKTEHCQTEENALYLDLQLFGIQGRNTKFFLTRTNGTSLYATRDIAYHQWKAQHADRLINILGEDHKLESKQVEIALTLLNISPIPTPIFYAFVSLPEGKMSTRRGRVVYIDELIEESIQRAYQEVKKRRGDELTQQQMHMIAETVGIGAIRYNIIRVQPEKDIVFKWEDALNFEGNAIPFIQYAHARTAGILKKTTEPHSSYDATLFTHSTEKTLLKHLARYPLLIENASQEYKPHIIATYLYETAAKFNQFYRDCPVLPEKYSKRRHSRLALVYATKIVLNNALDLLGITAPEEM